MDDGRCLLDVIDDPDALTSFLDKQDEFGLDSADLEEFSRYQQQSLLTNNQYAIGPNPSASMAQETPSSVLMRLENISPPPIQNDTVLSLLGDRPFTPTSHKPQNSQAASRPIIDLGFGEQEGGEIKEIFPDFMMGSGQVQAGNNQAFSAGDDLFGKLGVKESVGGSIQRPSAKNDFSSIFSFEEEGEKLQHAVPPSSISSGNVQDVIQQSLMLSGVGNLSDDVPTQQEPVTEVTADKGSERTHAVQSLGGQPAHSIPQSHALPSSFMVQGGSVQSSNAQDHQKMTTKSIPQVAVVRPQTQPQPQPQTQVLATQPVIDAQGQVINSQFLQTPGKVIGSAQQTVMPMQQTYVLNTKAPLNIHPKLGISPPAASKPQPQQGIRIMLAPQGGNNIQTIGGAPAGQTIQLNHGQAGPTGQQTVVLHNVQGAVQGAVQPAGASSVPVLQPVITIGATQGSFIFMTRPPAVLAPQQIQQLQTSGSGLATIQMPGQAMAPVVQPVNQQQGGKQALPVMQLVQSGVSAGKAYQTIALPQGYVTGGQTIVIQNPQGSSNVLPIAQSQASIVQSGANQVGFVQSKQPGTYSKVQTTPQLIQPKVVSSAQAQTKVGPISSQSLLSSTAYRTKDIAYTPPSKMDVVSYQSPANSEMVTSPVTYTSSIVNQNVANVVQPYAQSVSTAKNEVQVIKPDLLPASKVKPVETFRHKLYGKISTLQSDSKQTSQSELQSSQAQMGAITLANQTSRSLQTILQKVQPRDAGTEQSSSSQLSQALSSTTDLRTQSQPIFIQQNSPPANTIVTPSNVNAKGLPTQTQTLPGNNGSVPALVQHSQLAQLNLQSSVSSAAVSIQTPTVVSTSPNTNSLPTKKTQLKKQNMFGSRPVASVDSSNFQGEFLKTLQGKPSHVVASGTSTSAISTLATSSILTTTMASSTAGSQINQGGHPNEFTSGSHMLASNTNVTSSLENTISSGGMMSSAGGVPSAPGLMSALELKAKQMQESGMKSLANNQQPMVSALQLKAQQMMTPQSTSFNQQPIRPNAPMISALQLKKAGHFQGQGVNAAGNTQPMISALEVQQQMQRQGQGMNVAQQPGTPNRPMVSALQLQQLKRQMSSANPGVDNAALMNQLLQLQQRKNAVQAGASPAQSNQMQAQAIVNQSQISRPPSAGQPLPSPQGGSRPPSIGQPLPSPQSNQSHRPPSVPLSSPQGMPPHRPPSAGQPVQSPQAMQPHRPSSAGQPLPSPQGRQTSRPPSVGHPLPSPQGQPLASPQGMAMPSHHSQHVMGSQGLQSPQNVLNSGSQVIQSNQSTFAPISHNTTGQHVMQSSAPVHPVQAGQVPSQSSTKMMPQLLQAFDLLKKAQAAQAKGPSGAQEQAHYMQQFQLLLQKHPDLMKQLQHLKHKQQLAKQQQMVKQQHMGASMPAGSFQQIQQTGVMNQQQFQQQHVLSASADQAQLVASSILQATQNASAAYNTRHGGIPSSTGESDVQQLIRPGSTTFSTNSIPKAPDGLQNQNPNYTPNVTIQAVNTGQKDGTQRLAPGEGSFLPNQGQQPVVSSSKKKPPPNTSMMPPPPPAPQQAPPNVSILPSQKQAPLGTIPSVTKEKDVFEFDDDDPVPVKVENKFSRKTSGGKTGSGTVHHQPLPMQQRTTQGQAAHQIEPTGVPQESAPAQMTFVGSQSNQLPSQSGQMSLPQSNASQGSHLSRMLQSAPQMTLPSNQMNKKPGFEAGLTSQGYQYGQVPQGNLQSSPVTSLGSQGTPSQVTTPRVSATSINAGGSVQKDSNVATRRLQQLQQSQQATSTVFKPKAKAKTSHFSVQTQQSLHSVQGFIRQLEGIINRTPKQEAMLQQLLDLQQKINDQARAKLEGTGTPTPSAKPVGGATVEKVCAAGLSNEGKGEVTTAASGTQNAASSTFSTAGSNLGASGTTPQSYGPVAATTNIPKSAAGTAMPNQPPSTTGQYKMGNTEQQTSYSFVASAAAAAATAAAQATSQTSTAGPPAAQGSTQPVVPTSSIPTPVSGVQIPSSSSGPTTLQQIFTTNIVQLVGKNLTPQQQDVLRRLQEQLKNMTPQQQQEFYRQHQVKLQHGQKKVQDVSSSPVQPVQQPTSSTPAPKAQLSPVRAPKPSRSKAKKKGAKASPKGDRMEDKGGKEVEIISPPPPPKAPTPPPAAAEFIRERRDLDKYCVENIQFKTPFASYNEAMQRLLPYHIAHEKIPSKENWKETESSFNEISNQLMAKKKKMLDKFQYLLYQESMIEVPSSEVVMLGRLFHQDETAALQEERNRVEANRGLVESLMPKIESNQDQETTNAQAVPVESPSEHSFAQPAKVAPTKAEPRHKTNHDRIRKSPEMNSSRRSGGQGVVLQRQRQVSGDGDTSSSTEGQYQSSIVSKYGSSDEDDGSKGGSSGGGIRLRLTKSLLVESKVKSRDRSVTSESDDSVLSSPTKPKRRKSQLEALLSSDSLDSSDYSPSIDYRTRGSVWKVSEKSKDLFAFQESDASTCDTVGSQSRDRNPSGNQLDAIMDEDSDGKDMLQEQMDSAVNSILFLQNPGPSDTMRHASLADISFDQDDVFDSADDSAVFNLEDYANASFLEENSAAAGLETELNTMDSDVEEAVRSIL